MSGAVRPAGARIGLTLLNILGPGVALLRTGRPRLALAFLAAPSLLLALILLYYAFAPILSPIGYAAIFALIVLTVLVLYVAAMVATWRTSRLRPDVSPWWSRWYVMLLAVLGAALAANLLTAANHAYYKPFYVPSEGMAPTLDKNDRFLAAMGRPSAPRRGDIILFEVGERFIYVQRIVGLPGDRVALKDGIVILNGRPVAQRLVGEEALPNPPFMGPGKARRLLEQFPGEAGPHAIYDLGPSDVDNVEEVRVEGGHVFVLGDNRDRSADSRVEPESMGVGPLPLARVKGRALFITWGPEGRMGERLD